MSQPSPVNIRFWIYWNMDYVKITLRPGQQISLSHYDDWGPEGGRFTQETYEYDDSFDEFEDRTLLNMVYTRSVDCDGRFETGNDYFCSVNNLPSADCRDEMEKIPFMPKEFRLKNQIPWMSQSTYQRDHAAEAMGY